MAERSQSTCNCLRIFVEGYLQFFELYFTEYYKHLTEIAARCEKAERFIANISELVKIDATEAESVDGCRGVIAANIIAQLLHFSEGPYDWKLIKKLSLKISNATEDPLIVKQNVIEGAGQIFAHFEAQFMNISSDVSLESALKRIALDAVNRAISHLRENPDSNVDSITLCRGLMKGKSKKCDEYAFWRCGHSIKLGESVYSPEFLKKLGVKHNGIYYAHKDMKHSLDSLGFRLSFEREPITCQHYSALPKAPTNEYEYLLSQELLKELLANFSRSKDDALELCDEELDEIRKQAKEHARSVLENIGKNQSAVDKLLKEIIEKIKSGPKTVKPICSVGQPVKCFVGRTQELDRIDDMVKRQTLESSELHSLVTVISGLGGLGKSELARKYAHKHRGSWPDDDGRWKFFDAVWLDAEDGEAVASSFKDLAQRYCGLPIKDATGVNRKIADIVKDVYSFLSDRHSTQDQLTLIVFDNIRLAFNLVSFLPPVNSLPPKFRVLITSRHTEWQFGENELNVLSLDALQPDEAVELIKTRTHANDDHVLDELSRELQYFPLGLHLAVTYILNAQESDATLSTQHYLEEFLTRLKELGESSKFDGLSGGGRFTRSTLAAYDMLVERLEAEEFGALANRFLNIVGYIGTSNIQIEMFCFLKGLEKKAVKNAVLLLVKYSLVKWDEQRDGAKMGVVCVQRLLQEMIRLRLERTGGVRKALDETMALLMSEFDHVFEVHFESYLEQLGWLLLGDVDLDQHIFGLLDFIEEADRYGLYSTPIFRLKEKYFRKIKGDSADEMIASSLFQVARQLFHKSSRYGNLGGLLACKNFIKECLDLYEKRIKPEEVPDLLLRKLRLYNGLWEIGILEEHLGGSGRPEIEETVKQHVPAILEACERQDDFMEGYMTYWVVGKAYMTVGEKEKAKKYLMDWLSGAELEYKDELVGYVDALLAFFRYNSEGQLGVEKGFVMWKLKAIFGDSLGHQTYYAEEPYEFEPSCAIDGAVFSPPPPPEPPAPNQADVVVEQSLLSRLLRLRFRINF